MTLLTNHVGERFGRLLVLKRGGSDRGNAAWVCLCDCGTTVTVRGSRLRSGETRSCGCLQRERTTEVSTTHGQTGSPEHNVWAHMIARCENPKAPHFARYGGRGIRVCERWRSSFASFLSDMGPRPSLRHTIDRKDNDGHYEPSNCRWATKLEQARNKSNNRIIEVGGVRKCLAEWAAETGINVGTLADRLDAGWDPARAVTQPTRRRLP